MLPFETRHRPQFRCMRLLAQLLKHWSRATAVEPVFFNQRAKQNVPYERDNLNPGFARLTAQLRFSICPSCAMESNLQAASRDPLVAKNAETCAVVLMSSATFAACEILSPAATSYHNRPITCNLSVLSVVSHCHSFRPVHTGRSPRQQRHQFAKRSAFKC